MTLRRDLAFPLQRDLSGRWAVADEDEHLRDLMAQVLFTLPGERLNLPDFGAGVQRLVFANLSDDVVHSAQFTVQAQLQRWLGEYVHVEAVSIRVVDSRLTVEVAYAKATADERRAARFLL